MQSDHYKIVSGACVCIIEFYGPPYISPDALVLILYARRNSSSNSTVYLYECMHRLGLIGSA